MKLPNGQRSVATRWMRTVPVPSAWTPPAGPVHDSPYTPLVGSIVKFDRTETPPEFDPITGLNAAGWTRDGWHNHDRYDRNGLDRDGYPRYRQPLDDIGFTPLGFDAGDFDRAGIHRDTGTIFNPDGYDRHSFPAEVPLHRAGAQQRNPGGFGPDGIHQTTGTRFDDSGFDWDYIHQTTGTRFDPRGFGRYGLTRDRTGFDADGRDFRGCDASGRDLDGNHHSTGTPLDRRGFDAAGVNTETGTRLDAEGWDVNYLRKNGRADLGGRNFYGMHVR